MPFRLRHVLRQIPKISLEEYFRLRSVQIDPTWWKKPEPKLATLLASHVVSNRNAETDEILADLVRVNAMSSERGHAAFLNAAAHETRIVDGLAKKANDFDRALWMILAHEEIFRASEELLYFDLHSAGARGRHYTTTAGLQVSQSAEDVAAFEAAVCAFYRRHDGSGASCHVEFADRHETGAVQITLYVEGLPDHLTEFVDREFRRRISFPGKEAAVVYERAGGKLSTVAKGGKDIHEALREGFARNLLKIEPRFRRCPSAPLRIGLFGCTDELWWPTQIRASKPSGCES